MLHRIQQSLFLLLSLSNLCLPAREIQVERPIIQEEEIHPPPPLAIAPPENPPSDWTASNIWTPKEWQNWVFAGGAAVMAIAGIIIVTANQGHDSPTPAE